MSLIAARNDVDFVLDEAYAKGKSRGSNVHTGSNPSNKSTPTAKGAFSGINLADVFINEPGSKLFLRRWVISDEFLNSKLLDLAS